MCLVKEKSLEDKYKISRSIVEEAYPDIEWRDKHDDTNIRRIVLGQMRRSLTKKFVVKS